MQAPERVEAHVDIALERGHELSALAQQSPPSIELGFDPLELELELGGLAGRRVVLAEVPLDFVQAGFAGAICVRRCGLQLLELTQLVDLFAARLKPGMLSSSISCTIMQVRHMELFFDLRMSP